jgi:DNA-binding NarL/FixJ family response regulator
VTIRVIIVDDHPMYRIGVAAILEHADDIQVVAEAADGDELVATARELRPDVVLTDLSMPGMDGASATKALLSEAPDTAVLVVSMHEDDQHVVAALRAGAAGYLVKGADGDEILRAIRAVAAGGAVYGASVARKITAHYAGADEESPLARSFPTLTPRECDVLELLAEGCRNHEIARRLFLSEKTVRNHISQVLMKLGVPDRTAAALMAREAGL